MTDGLGGFAENSLGGWELNKPSELGIVLATTSAIIIVRFILPLILKRSSQSKLPRPPWFGKKKLLEKSPGLYNPSNICYANSVMQALSTSGWLLKNLIINDYKDAVLDELSSILHVLGTELIPNSFKYTDLRIFFDKLRDLDVWKRPIHEQEDCFYFYLAIMDYIKTKHQAFIAAGKFEQNVIQASEITSEIKLGYRFSCEHCDKSNEFPVVQTEFCINLNLMDDDVELVDLVEMLTNYFKTESIEQSKCEFCPEVERDKHKTCFRRTTIVKPPKLLVIRINRVYYDERGRKYLNRKNVDYPLLLNINDVLDRSRKRKQSRWDVYPYYRLVAVILHYGNVYNGHYVCQKLWPTIGDTASLQDNKIPHFEKTWNYISDAIVEEVSPFNLYHNGALPCMFFYERV